MSIVNNINIQRLSQSERILLAEELWHSVAKNQADLDVTDAQRQIPDERMAAYKASPNEDTCWGKLKTK